MALQVVFKQEIMKTNKAQRVYVTEVIANQFQSLGTDKRQKRPDNLSTTANIAPTNSVSPVNDNVSGNQFLDSTNFEISDNDLPF